MKAEVSIPVALATAALTWGIYQAAMPTLADVRGVEPNNADVAKAERTALMLAVGVAGGVSLLAKDSVPFIVSGLLAVGLSWSHRVANMTDSTTQRIFNRDQYLGERYTVEAVG
jgi:hypothetical protein